MEGLVLAGLVGSDFVGLVAGLVAVAAAVVGGGPAAVGFGLAHRAFVAWQYQLTCKVEEEWFGERRR